MNCSELMVLKARINDFLFKGLAIIIYNKRAKETERGNNGLQEWKDIPNTK